MARWAAERTGQNEIVLLPELAAVRDEPEVVEQLALQRQLLINRRAALRSELAAIDEGVAGTQALLSGMQSLLSSKQQQKRLLNEQLSGIRGLAAKGYVARNQSAVDGGGACQRGGGDFTNPRQHRAAAEAGDRATAAGAAASG
ncbi:hypothetical protein ACQFN5_02760 [Klebsiella sp. WOUb02]|uniref:hypothetical protein n=1 Tax=Klebsiella sp. WOUb02 TaxID=3161071 RepID=UPI003D075A13